MRLSSFPAGEIGERLNKFGLTQALFNLPPGDFEKGERGISALPGREAEFIQSLEIARPYILATGTKRVHLMGGLVSRSDATAMTRYKDAIKRTADTFGPLGLDIVLEPLNARDVPGYILDNFDFAADLIAGLAISNVKLQFDIYHCQILHGDVTMRMRRMMPLIGHVQVASVPTRNEPMSEELNDTFVFAEFDHLGYAGFIGCEYRPKGNTEAGLGWFAPYRKK
jgi:2-dehydrotetronate isomerase